MDMDLIDEVVDFVFDGAIDPREVRDFISKSGPDASEVHVNSAGSKKVKEAKAFKKKKREVEFGLANNAFGAGMGAIATGTAYKEARKYTPKKMAATKVGRVLNKLKIKPKVAVPVAGAALVGGQLINGAMDAQSAQYFARERIKMQKEKVKKASDDILYMRRMGHIDTERALELIDKAYNEIINSCGECGGPTPENQAWCDTCLEVKTVASREQDRQTVGKGIAKSSVRIITPDPVDDGDSVDLGWDGSISKVDTDKRQVFGWCSLTEVNGEKIIDRQGDYIPLDEVEKSAYNYVIHSRKGGDMHKRDGEQPLHTSDMIESFVVTPEKLTNLGLERDALPHGWWIGFKVNDDDQWDSIKKGERAHFSIHGKGRRVEKSL